MPLLILRKAHRGVLSIVLYCRGHFSGALSGGALSWGALSWSQGPNVHCPFFVIGEKLQSYQRPQCCFMYRGSLIFEFAFMS